MNRGSMFVVAGFAATNLLAGYSYHFQTVISGPRGDVSTAGTATVEGSKMRVEFDTGDRMLFPDKERLWP